MLHINVLNRKSPNNFHHCLSRKWTEIEVPRSLFDEGDCNADSLPEEGEHKEEDEEHQCGHYKGPRPQRPSILNEHDHLWWIKYKTLIIFFIISINMIISIHVNIFILL